MKIKSKHFRQEDQKGLEEQFAQNGIRFFYKGLA